MTDILLDSISLYITENLYDFIQIIQDTFLVLVCFLFTYLGV